MARFYVLVVVSMGGMGDSFYEYLFKSFLQSNGKDVKAKDLYFSAMQVGYICIDSSSRWFIFVLTALAGG